MTPPTELCVGLIVAGDVPSDALDATVETLNDFGVRTFTGLPNADLAGTAARQGWRAVIVASADGVLPATVAGALPLPVVRVPIESAATGGLALLHSPGGNLPASEIDGVSFATVAIGVAGAKNAALFVISMLALDDERLRAAWEAFRAAQTEAVLQQPPPTLV